MAQGYAGYIGFAEHYLGWGSSATCDLRNFLDPESETLDLGLQERRRENKIRGERALSLDLVTVDTLAPAGAVVLQPRSDELAALMAAHFQAWSRSGEAGGATWVGTLIYAMVPTSPHFGGSHWGIFNPSDNLFNGGTAVRDIYPLHLWKSLGVPTETVYSAKIGFDRGYVEQMEWRVTWDTDLVVTPTFSFRGTTPNKAFLSAGSEGVMALQGTSPFNIRFSGWNGTITVDGTANTTLDIEEWNLTTTAGGEARGRIGNHGPMRFPYENAPTDLGGFLMEFKSSKWIERTFSGTGTFGFAIRFQTSATHWVQIDQPHCRFKPITPQITGRDARIDTAFEYEAFGSAGTPSTIVSLHTRFATSAFSLDGTIGVFREE